MKKCILIGGSYNDCINWIDRNNLRQSFHNFIFAFDKSQIQGLHNVEVIEIYNAHLNPLYKSEYLKMLENDT